MADIANNGDIDVRLQDINGNAAIITTDGKLQVENYNSLSASASYGAISVTTTATQIIASNTSRKYLAITNNGSKTVYLGDIVCDESARR